ncbi:hypothetical protein [Neobacillus niacini]|nr:hypothetical protein [Neobacillus niacini]MDR7001048.1 hypothetical protein [Neobacillus niacini]
MLKDKEMFYRLKPVLVHPTGKRDKRNCHHRKEKKNHETIWLINKVPGTM